MENLLNILTELSKSLRANHTYKKSTTDCFNIFNVLGVQSREVIICRFIGELIKPDGAHNMGIVPLKLFFKEVLKQDISDADAQNAEIVLEDKIDDKRRVDIAIFVGNKVYPIEAKVWAIDQKSQLFDYYSYYKKENKDIDKIYYLTPSGKAPSKDSIKSLIIDNIRCISFENEVLSWITNIKIDVDCNLKSALKQFEEVIIDMTAEFKKYSAITNILNIDDAEHYSSNELLKAAVILMNNKDDIIKTVTLNYIKTKIYVGTDNKYIKVELNNDTKSKSVGNGPLYRKNVSMMTLQSVIELLHPSLKTKNKIYLKKLWRLIIMTTLTEIRIENLKSFENNPFIFREDTAFEMLIDSIANLGVLTPIIVRNLDDGNYEIISGHRRAEACKHLGIETIPCIVKELTRDEATVENSQSFISVAQDNEISNINGNKFILKLHGDLKHRNIILKEEDYLNYSETFKLTETLLKQSTLLICCHMSVALVIIV